MCKWIALLIFSILAIKAEGQKKYVFEAEMITAIDSVGRMVYRVIDTSYYHSHVKITMKKNVYFNLKTDSIDFNVFILKQIPIRQMDGSAERFKLNELMLLAKQEEVFIYRSMSHLGISYDIIIPIKLHYGMKMGGSGKIFIISNKPIESKLLLERNHILPLL